MIVQTVIQYLKNTFLFAVFLNKNSKVDFCQR